MNRREFIKLACGGAATLLLSGCGLLAVGDTKGKASTSNESSKSTKTGENGKMKIVVVTGSPHSEEESTSKYLTVQFIKGAQEAGHEVFRFDAASADIHPCQGCDRCHMDGPCVFKDDIETKLMPKMLEMDMIVLSTPLYYYGMSAQLKTIVDRFYSRTGHLTGKKSMLIATAYNSADWTFEALMAHYDTLVRYMDWTDVGTVLGYGCGSRELAERSEFGEKAYKIGKRL